MSGKRKKKEKGDYVKVVVAAPCMLKFGVNVHKRHRYVK
jgi:hypothetical protein